ncbi:hypothetical protein B0T20DRAFT_485087, partial [Sordaria brevicollis]
MWSLGVTVFEILTNKLPFGDNGADSRDFVRMWDDDEHCWVGLVPKRKWKKMRHDHLPWFVAYGVSTAAQRLLYALWTEFDKRPTAVDAMKHEWFKTDLDLPMAYLLGGNQERGMFDWNYHFPEGLIQRFIKGKDSSSDFLGLRRIPGDSQRFRRASTSSTVTGLAQSLKASFELEVSPYQTPQMRPQVVYGGDASLPKPQKTARRTIIEKPGQDALHICPYTKLYGGERSPFEKDTNLTCDEYVAFLRLSDLLRHINERHISSSMPAIPDYAFNVTNTPEGKQQ